LYGGALTDAPSVLAAPPEPFDAHGLLVPYAFFDVARGREGRGGGHRGGAGPAAAAPAAAQSLRNTAEADLAVALFREVGAALAHAAAVAAARSAGAASQAPPPPARPLTVGVITPYRRQVDTLRSAFARLALPDGIAELRVETVDAFQGKEVDVAILSCVRARGGGGGGGGGGPPGGAPAHRSVGFVADVRRLNVAITRARRALWILGHAVTLSASPVWAALIADARARGLLVEDAAAAALFPHQFHGGSGAGTPGNGWGGGNGGGDGYGGSGGGYRLTAGDVAWG
jgi:senataxin